MNREQGTRNREQGTGNREQGTRNRELSPTYHPFVVRALVNVRD
ncbi:MAG: hypothetical protein ACK6A9_03080 [Dolichospermum sp.]